MNAQQIIQTLAAELKVPAEYLWAVLVRQARVEFFQSLAWFAVVVALWVAVAVVARRIMRSAREEWTEYEAARAEYDRNPRETPWPEKPDGWADNDGAVIGATILGALLVLVTMLGFADLITNAGHLANPEYFALDRVLDALK